MSGACGDLAEIAATPAWLDVLRRVDAVVHAAAFMEFWGPDQLFVDRNLRPAVTLYRAAVAARVKRFALISAASVPTGSNRADSVNEGSDPGRPNIAYSRVKLRTEQELLALPHGDTTLVVLRPPFLWGSRSAHNLEGFAESVEAGRFSWIDGGRHLVDYCHFDNLAHAVTLAMTRGEHGLICYITGGLMETAAKARRSTTPPPITHWIVRTSCARQPGSASSTPKPAPTAGPRTW